MSQPKPLYSHRDDGLADLLVPAELHAMLLGELTRRTNRVRRNGGRPDPRTLELARVLRECIEANRSVSADGHEPGRDAGQPQQWLTTAQAARVWGVTPRTARRRADQLGARRAGGQYLIPAAAVHADTRD